MGQCGQIKFNDEALSEVRVLGEGDRELYLEATRKAAEQFGLSSVSYRRITQGIHTKNVTGSQYFWATHLNSCLPNEQKVISLEEMEIINNVDTRFFQGFYAYIPEIILRTETPINQQDRFILDDLGRQIKAEHFEFSSDQPLRISNLELVKDDDPDNVYGLLLKIGNETHISVDPRFSAKTGSDIPFGDKTKRIWTHQNGVSAICLAAGVALYTDEGFGLYADCICRSVVMEREKCH